MRTSIAYNRDKGTLYLCMVCGVTYWVGLDNSNDGGCLCAIGTHLPTEPSADEPTIVQERE